MGPLSEVVERVFIVRYKENIEQLKLALLQEGFNNVETLTRSYSEAEKSYSRSFRCLLSHQSAWRRVEQSDGLCMIVEADFVPCFGIGQMSVPIPETRLDSAWSWLYSSAQRIYEYEKPYIRGHSATTVAYLMNSAVARKVKGFVDHERKLNPPTQYSPWDTYIRMYAQNQDVAMFLTAKSYGEHGGLVNNEHQQNNITGWHQADVLAAPLHFLPAYASGSKIRYLWFRFRSYLKAWARIFTFRYIERATISNRNVNFRYRARMVGLAISRMLPWTTHFGKDQPR